MNSERADMNKERAFEKMAEAVENYLQLYGHPHMTIIADLTGIEVVEGIKAKPFTVDPVKHGRWIFTGRTYKCSCCCLKEDNAVGADLCDMPLLNFKYCPHCGAKMDAQWR